jgi:2-(1,2-epoxy-1,2-dihydrophenyl)acetyl-CoA isomerase
MTGSDLIGEQAGEWLVLRLNRPEVRNALRTATWQQLNEALDEVEGSDLAGLILTGGDQWFSSGADLREAGGTVDGSGPGSLWPATTRLRLAQRTIERLRAFPKPTVAAVEGYAIGVAWSLALSCDLIVASSASFFAQPAAAAGMAADAGLVRDLCQTIGYHAAVEALLCRTRLAAPEAMTAGMLTRLSEPGAALSDALGLAEAISAVPAPVRFVLKSLLVSARAGTDGSFLEHEAVAIAFNKLQPAHADGRASFRQGARFFGS